jgi:lauroyl/myristoyl acyltransferase
MGTAPPADDASSGGARRAASPSTGDASSTVPAADTPAHAPAASGRTLRGSAILAGAHLLARLPEPPLVAAAEAIGELWYRVQPRRAAQARANLGRVCVGLAAQGRGSSLVRRAATDPDALERIVRAAFRHAARYYLEVARAGAYEPESILARIDVQTPGEIETALRSGKPVILIGMHYGAIEVPTIVARDLVGHTITAPMETVADPGLQRWFVESRSRVGVRIVPISDARRALTSALRRGESVGMVADRDLTGGGIMVPFFGHPAPIPAGAALLSIETGVPVYVGWARRTKGYRYRGGLALVPQPGPGKLRARVTELTTSIVREFETLLADGPEQWWGAFHPIWPDLVVADEAADGRPAGGSPDAGATA